MNAQTDSGDTVIDLTGISLPTYEHEYDPEGYFGRCPECGSPGLAYNVGDGGKHTYIACAEHRVCWYVGYKLLWPSEFQDQADWDRNAETLADYRLIESEEAIFERAE